jgi:hypothetical protein
MTYSKQHKTLRYAMAPFNQLFLGPRKRYCRQSEADDRCSTNGEQSA